MKVLITGATGFIGKELGKALTRKGHQVLALSRSAKKAAFDLPYPAEIIEGDLATGPLESSKLDDVEAVIHLAGENIGEGRWNKERKKRILSSRATYAQSLIQSLPKTVQVFISASAVGYYGDRKQEVLTENSSKGAGFLSDVCEQWENAVFKGQQQLPKTRFVVLRTGVVVAPFGGALMKMLPPFQMGLGGVLSSGDQWMSWIHLQDLINLYVQALENSNFTGIYNAVAPEAVTNAEWTRELAQGLRVRQGPPVPALALQVLYGEMSSLILASQHVKSSRLQNFHFHFATIKNAFESCCQPYREGDQVFFAEQYFPFPREKVFYFFSKAENLEAITPPLLKFKVQEMSTPEVQQGTLIDYRLKVHGIPMKWKTLIEAWRPPECFVDIQLKGPYQKWQHAHSFEELGKGTVMTDVIRYKLPVGLLGQIFGGSFVRADVEKIFSFRKSTVNQLLTKV